MGAAVRDKQEGNKGCPQRTPLLTSSSFPPCPPHGQKLRRRAGFDLKQNKPQAGRFTDQGFLESAWNLVETNFFLGWGGGREKEQDCFRTNELKFPACRPGGKSLAGEFR